MRGLLSAVVLLYGVVVLGAFAVGRRNVDPETNMNIVSCGAGRVVARGRAGPAAVLWLQPLNGGSVSSETRCAVWFRESGPGLLPAPVPRTSPSGPAWSPDACN